MGLCSRKRTVSDPSVPENFGYARASQVCAVEPSFADTKRLSVSNDHELRRLEVSSETRSKKTAWKQQRIGCFDSLLFCFDSGLLSQADPSTNECAQR